MNKINEAINAIQAEVGKLEAEDQFYTNFQFPRDQVPVKLQAYRNLLTDLEKAVQTFHSYGEGNLDVNAAELYIQHDNFSNT